MTVVKRLAAAEMALTSMNKNLCRAMNSISNSCNPTYELRCGLLLLLQLPLLLDT
jgi:hypothetical protein